MPASTDVPLLAAVPAPTAFAVATAERADLTLVGFARQQDLVVYCRPKRLDWDPLGPTGPRHGRALPGTSASSGRRACVGVFWPMCTAPARGCIPVVVQAVLADLGLLDASAQQHPN